MYVKPDDNERKDEEKRKKKRVLFVTQRQNAESLSLTPFE